ncbi:MAG: DUF4435 domain-containing protein [Alphaproteobacteria bacterium]
MTTQTQQTSFAEDLQKAKHSAASVYHQYKLNRETKSHYFLFVEGNDDKLYYTATIHQKDPELLIHTYICNNKKNVISLLQHMEAKKENLKKCLFFVDRDYDCFFSQQTSSNDNLYITDLYSIENQIINENSLGIALRDYTNINHNDVKAATELYKTSSLNFYRQLKPFIAFCLANREIGHKPVLNSINMNSIFTINRNYEVTKKADSINTFLDSSKINDVKIKYSQFKKWYCIIQKTKNNKLWVRGKFDLWFFLLFLEQYCKNNGLKTTFLLEHKKAFEMLSGKVSPPKSLLNFITRKTKT